MDFFDIYPAVLAVLFTFMLGWLMPRSGKTYDVLKFRLDLFPQWFKWVGGCWFLLASLITFFVFRSEESWEYFLLANIDFSFFVIFFSKQKNEDEFSEQIRIKAFVYAFISFVAVLIIYGSAHGSSLFMPVIFSDFSVFILFFMGIAQIFSLIYFYTSVYKSSRSN